MTKHINSLLTVNRRSLLLGGMSVLAGGMTATLCPPLSQASTDAAALDAKFMQASNFLINHKLNPQVGVRIAHTARTLYGDLSVDLDEIISVAKTANATVVEQFFDNIPEGKLRDLCFWIIAAWYSGSSSDKRDAVLFTYEEALTFKTTSDVVGIPSFGLTGPNLWHRPTVPLGTMPNF